MSDENADIKTKTDFFGNTVTDAADKPITVITKKN